MPNWEEIRREWESSSVSFKELADKHEVKDSTIRSRKNREKWQRNNATQRKKKNVATKKNAATPQRKSQGAPKGNKYAAGNRGNPNPTKKFTERNSAALKHGLFSRYMPKETLEIMNQIEEATPADLIWFQIQIQFSAILRAQEIMFVESKDEMIKELKKRKDTEYGEEIEYEFQFAWDRQATFLNAQSRAITELRSSIKQFEEMAHVDDERRLKLEQMRLSIDKTKAEIDNLTDEEEDKPIEIVIKRKE
jgi:uncharacterized protein YjcR